MNENINNPLVSIIIPTYNSSRTLENTQEDNEQEIAKLGYNVKIHTKYNIYHDYNDFTFIGNLKKKFYYGKSLDEYKKK